MNYYNKKCKGCGGYFSNDENNPSYVKNPKEDTLYCYRCFQLINYGKYVHEVKDHDLKQIFENFDIKNNTIVLVVDLFDINKSLIDEYKNANELYLVVNKLSCFPKSFNHQLTIKSIKDIFIELGWNNFKNIFMYDAKDKFGIKSIYENIFNKQNKTIYFIGRTNAGKSLLINSILKLNSKKPVLTTVSPYINTTISFNKIKVDRFNIIDTPGYPTLNSTRYIEPNNLKSIYNSKFSIIPMVQKSKDSKQSYLIGDIISISLLENNENASLVFYTYSSIKIHRTKYENKDKLLNSSPIVFPKTILEKKEYVTKIIDLDPNKKYTLFLSGLGFVVIKRVSKIELSNIKEIDLFITKNSII